MNLRVLAAVLILTGPSCALAAQQSAPPPNEAVAEGAPRLPDTLMFSIDEMTEIQSLASVAQAGQNGAEQRRAGDAIEGASLYLSTILYYGPKDWTIWINGRPITPGSEFESFQITSINPEAVELLVPLSAQGMRPVTLSPNQSFIVKSGMIVEGPWK